MVAKGAEVRPRSERASKAPAKRGTEAKAELEVVSKHSNSGPKDINFTVDSALLQELGERLVGRPHIALAELIKNSFDADATVAEVTVSADEIEIIDDGHGMDFEAFESYWMRIGSPHKGAKRVSPGGRAVTGSKGVGRLSAQFLADKIELTTRSEGEEAVRAEVDWREAVAAKDLTKATAQWDYVEGERFAGNATHGTRIRLLRLKQAWDAGALEALARELWPLQPPFASEEEKSTFRVELASADPEGEKTFERQMRAILELWEARITGSIERGRDGSGVHKVRIQFRDDTFVSHEVPIHGLLMASARYEVRAFTLENRQPHGIGVEAARNYLRDFGGVHVYDAKFHLPYYGPQIDWLGVEQDHAHRLSKSQLLPAELQVSEGMNFLPTNSRLFGTVQIDTGAERDAASEDQLREGEVLSIQISRDRLIDNRPYRQLVNAVRWSLDLYAMEQARRSWSAKEPKEATLSEQATRIEDVLERYREEIPDPVRTDLLSSLAELAASVESEAEQAARQASLLGSLATAGISAIAIEHEAGRQNSELERLTRRIERYAKQSEDPKLAKMAAELKQWSTTSRSTRALFGAFLDEESREKVQRLGARSVIERTVEGSKLLLRGVTVDASEVSDELVLPEGRFADWTAIFQNVLVNSANATLDSEERLIAINSGQVARNVSIHIQDTGSGVDLNKAEELFLPFVREQEISEDRRALGAGGTGLGLTIVQMMARSLGCRVAFAEPEKGFATSFRLSWRIA